LYLQNKHGYWPFRFDAAGVSSVSATLALRRAAAQIEQPCRYL
jgi:hypothetical protein